MKLSANGKRIGRPPIYTPEERAERDRASRRAADAKRLANLTDEQKQRRREADSRYKKNRPKTEALLARQREAVRKSRLKRKAEMTPEQLAAAKAKKKAYMQAYVLSDQQRERASKTSKEWAKNNRERVVAARKAWQAENPDAYRIYAQNRRARKRAQAGQVSADIVERLRVLQRDKCAACHVSLGDQHELDHVVPLAGGGAHDDRNLQLLCRTCNRTKGTKDPIDFMQSKGLLL